MRNDLFTPVASLPLLADTWAPHVSFVFNLWPLPEAERPDGERALAAEGGRAARWHLGRAATELLPHKSSLRLLLFAASTETGRRLELARSCGHDWSSIVTIDLPHPAVSATPNRLCEFAVA